MAESLSTMVRAYKARYEDVHGDCVIEEMKHKNELIYLTFFLIFRIFFIHMNIIQYMNIFGLFFNKNLMLTQIRIQTLID